MSAFPRVLSYQNSFLGSKFVVIGVVCCQEMRRNALFHKVLRVLTKYFIETIICFTDNDIVRKKKEVIITSEKQSRKKMQKVVK